MKSRKGVTLISLVIYVASFLVIVGIVALISNFFFSNSKVLLSQATASSEFDMLNAYLVKETKQYENWVINIVEDDEEIPGIEKKIIFNNGNEYIFIKEEVEETEVSKENKYGKIIFSSYDKYFVLCDYIDNLELPIVDNQETPETVEGKALPLEEFEIIVKILGKEYTKKYIIEK